MADLVPVSAVPLDALADEREQVRRHAEGLAVRWLHGYTNVRTRNGYAVDIGLSPEVRSALPGGPRNPEPLPVTSWIPWALDHGIDPAGTLSKAQAESYAHALSSLPKRTRQRRWSTLCAFYRSLRAEDVTGCNPGDLVNRRTMGLAGLDPSPTLPLHTRQVRALYQAAGKVRQNRARTQAMLAVLATTGCRAEELVRIDLDDYRPDPEGHALVLLHGKGGKTRWALLPAPDAALVAAYLDVRAGRPLTTIALAGDVSAAESAPLFTTREGSRLHVNAVTRMLATVAKQAGIPAPHPHQLRHTYAKTAEDAGVSVSQIQADLGHSSIATTQSYLHAGDTVEHSAARVVSGIYHAGT